ncbi:UNVERIFIED_CONTAM: hypothetical protein Sangu_2848500 [Sesamum angustifolium]|uniref:Uncharacterized protein n=1 Tax=Sesamum angustifolium TaxID=2727405 RepID=A0AAW2IQL0_9LAMI
MPIGHHLPPDDAFAHLEKQFWGRLTAQNMQVESSDVWGRMVPNAASLFSLRQSLQIPQIVVLFL